MAESAGRRLQGTAAAPGIGVGPAVVLRERRHRSDHRRIDETEVEAEQARLGAAVSRVLQELKRTQTQLQDADRSEHTSVALSLITSHRAVLTDPLLVDGVRRHIRQHHRNAEWAIECVVDELRNTMFALDNPGLRDWWRDVEGLVDTLLMNLGGGSGRRGFSRGLNVIAVARSMGIADAIELIEADGRGIVLEEGSLTSHVAVLCRAAGLPAVVGVADACSRFQNGRTLVVDGFAGTAEHADTAGPIPPPRPTSQPISPAVTKLGTAITVRANLSLQLDAAHARAHGTVGVGLMRTFYQYVGRATLPTEEELTKVYAGVARDFAPDPVAIRLLDLGGSFGAEELPAELRNLRDCRGIRLARERPAIVKTQVRALCRAAAVGNVRILVPFVTGPSEMQQVAEWVNEACLDVSTPRDQVQLGAMIEVPAAVIQIQTLAPLCDLFAIGTNDLAQYMLATSRDTPVAVTGPPHPAVITAIQTVCAAGKQHGIEVSLCGEVASEPSAIDALLHAGLRTLSVSPRLAPAVIAAIAASESA